MKTSTILSTFAAILPAFAAPAKRTIPPTTFGGVAIHSGSDIHLSSVNAYSRAFWLGKDTASYCPEEVVEDCPAGTSTLFSGGNSTLGLSVEVPGGQSVFVAADGSLGFTGAHSGWAGEGATTSGFSTATSGHLTFEGQDWYACAEDNAHKIYAASRSNGTSCTGFGWLLVGGTAPGAWEYS